MELLSVLRKSFTIILLFYFAVSTFAGNVDECNGLDFYSGIDYYTTNDNITLGWDMPTEYCDGDLLEATNVNVIVWQTNNTNSWGSAVSTNDLHEAFHIFMLEDNETLWVGFQSVDLDNENTSGRMIVRLKKVDPIETPPKSFFILR